MITSADNSELLTTGPIELPPRLAFVYAGCGPRTGLFGSTVDEHDLLRNAIPRYKDHIIHKYVLPAISGSEPIYENAPTTDSGWSDNDPDIVIRYVRWARHLGINTLVFSLYGGLVPAGGHAVFMHEPLNVFLERRHDHSDVTFAPMICTRLFRQHLPIEVPWRAAAERSRHIFVTASSFEFMVMHVLSEYVLPYRNSCLRIDGRPAMFVYDFVMLSANGSHMTISTAARTLERCRVLADKEFGEQPLFVAVVDSPSHAVAALQVGVDVITNYIDLPFFEEASAWPVQAYSDVTARRRKQWETIKNVCPLPFVPAAVSGFDASSRTLPIGRGTFISPEPYGDGNWYPLIPHIPHSADQVPEFAKYVRAASNFSTHQRTPFLNFGPLNEMTEQCCLLPRYRGRDTGAYDESIARVVRDEIAFVELGLRASFRRQGRSNFA